MTDKKTKLQNQLDNIYLIAKEKDRFFTCWVNAKNDYELDFYKKESDSMERKLEILISELGRM
jgi:hypothetical protein